MSPSYYEKNGSTVSAMEDITEWHGWKRSDTDTALHVGYLPGRRAACLYKVNGSVLTPLAYFRSEEAAREALTLLDGLVQA